MQLPFTKMHGAGNDFIVLDARATPIQLAPAQAASLADRRTGIGCDQLILIEPAANGADAFMRILNADGSEAGACGNATRCVTALLHEETGRARQLIRTAAGDLATFYAGGGRVLVDMGVPRFGWQDIPLAHEADTLRLPLPGGPAACSMGNPHMTFFVESAEDVEVLAEGPRWEHHDLFPERVNVGFAQVIAPDRVRLRVWERGAGFTRACGSGACAAVVNAQRRGLAVAKQVQVVMDGGTLLIERTERGHVLMIGPTAISFRGVVEL
jgi:diaminopimelate epimerase